MPLPNSRCANAGSVVRLAAQGFPSLMRTARFDRVLIFGFYVAAARKRELQFKARRLAKAKAPSTLIQLLPREHSRYAR